MRLRYFLAVFLILITSLLFSCRSSSSNSPRLLIYTPHGQDLLRDFVAQYKQKYPGAEVQFLDMGSREVLERVRVERNRPSWADKVPETSRDAQSRWYGTYETPQVIAYNSEAVNAADAPRDWDEVLDPKWRDKVLIRNPNPSDTMRAIFGSMIWRFHKDTGSPNQGYDWLRKLDANVHEYTADGTLLMQKLARREGVITLWDMPDVRLYQEQKNLPVAYNLPTSGTPVITDGIAIIRGAPNEEEARRFYEFVTTPESLAYAAHKYYRIPVRTDLDRSSLPAWMNERFKRMPLDWVLLRKQGSEWLRYWDTEIRGRSSRQ